eukprot:91113_1
MEHQFTESSISKSNCIQHAIESDTDRTDSKIIFDVNVNELIISDIPTTTNKKHHAKSVPIMKQIIYTFPTSQYSSQSEPFLSPTSESSYQCFFIDNNKEQSIIEQKKNNQINDIVIKDYFRPIQILNNMNHKSIDRSSIDRSHIVINTDNDIDSNLDSDDEDGSVDEDCFSLFNDSDHNSSDNESEFKQNKPYTINVPNIQIPKTKNELLKRVRPAFKLHLEMIDNDGSIKRQIIQHRKFVKKLNEKHNILYFNNEYDDNINIKFKNGKYRRKHIHRRKFSFRRKISNMFNYLIMENKGEIVNENGKEQIELVELEVEQKMNKDDKVGKEQIENANVTKVNASLSAVKRLTKMKQNALKKDLKDQSQNLLDGHMDDEVFAKDVIIKEDFSAFRD